MLCLWTMGVHIFSETYNHQCWRCLLCLLLYDMIYFLKGITKSLLIVDVGGVLAMLMPRLTVSKKYTGHNLVLVRPKAYLAYASSKLCEFVPTLHKHATNKFRCARKGWMHSVAGRKLKWGTFANRGVDADGGVEGWCSGGRENTFKKWWYVAVDVSATREIKIKDWRSLVSLQQRHFILCKRV